MKINIASGISSKLQLINEVIDENIDPDFHTNIQNAIQAVEKIFGVKVEKVNTSHVRGKLKRQGRYAGFTAARKKAVVQLTKDSKSIEFFENLA